MSDQLKTEVINETPEAFRPVVIKAAAAAVYFAESQPAPDTMGSSGTGFANLPFGD